MEFQEIINRIDRLNEIYSKADNEYLQHITNFKQSRQGVVNWQKYRFHYQIGINRANRMNPYKDIHQSNLTKN